MVAGLRAIAKAVESPPAPTSARASSRPYLRGLGAGNRAWLPSDVNSHERKSRLQTIVDRSNHNRPFPTAGRIRILIN